jgi:PTS system mannose-specific IID component
MPALPVRLAMFARSFAIQGSWNFRTLIGTGFAFALLPALRARMPGSPQDVDAAAIRHTELFNSHPYLVGVALGAVCRSEDETTDPRVVERFKSALRGSLGGMGDSLIWAGLRPMCALLGIALVFAGTPWWVGPLVFLVAYNIGHVALRVWGFRIGFRHGLHVGERLKRSRLNDTQQNLTRAGAFVLGLALPLMLARDAAAPLGWPWVVTGAILVVLGLRFGAALRTPIAFGVGGVLVVGLLLGLLR